MFQLFVLPIMAGLLFGCSTAPCYVNVDEDHPKALVKGKARMFTSSWIYIDAVDNNPVPHKHILGELSYRRPTPVYVTPGNHEILFDVLVSGQRSCTRKLSATFDAGHTYEASSRRPPFGELHIGLTDETGNQVEYENSEPYGNSFGGRVNDIMQFLPYGGGY